ncbi:MAG TPA: DUF4062 domain-containing protein [Thermoanaerobaculia bacterium]
MDKPIVFISSTSDLSEERKALLANLGSLYEPYLYEEERARRGSPEERCREMIESSHVFVGVLGATYGTPFPSDPQRSIVEWEIDTARQCEDVEIMAFLKKLPPGAEVDPRQKQLLDRVTAFESGLWCKVFESTDSLVQLVRSSLEGWLVEFWGRMQRRQLQGALSLHRILAAVAAVLVLGLVVLAVIAGSASPTKLAIASGAVAALVLLCLILFLAETGGRHGHSG